MSQRKMQWYSASLTEYKRLPTREVNVGGLLLGNFHPIRVQTMTTTDTMDVNATVEQSVRCIEAGAELVRITAPSIKEANSLQPIKDALRKMGYHTPLVADIHFTPNAAEVAARIVEKVRINPGNYVDKKKFEVLEYTDGEYLREIERIRQRFTPLVKICREYGTALRIGTNHGSLSDRIMSRYGDTPMGMVESAMEFLRIARDDNFHNIVLSMKSSNPQVMVQAYRLLVKTMFDEFGECYPLHLGVTEAGDGEDGRIKSAAGIGTLLEDGLGDTIRVSLTEDPELEIPVCRDLVKRYEGRESETETETERESERGSVPEIEKLNYDPFSYRRRESFAVRNIGGTLVPVVVADLSRNEKLEPADLAPAGYHYNAELDKWSIADAAADYIFTGHLLPEFALPGTLGVIVYPASWQLAMDSDNVFPIYQDSGYVQSAARNASLNFVMVDCYNDDTDLNNYTYLEQIANDPTVVLCLSSTRRNAMQAVRRMYVELLARDIRNPVVHIIDSNWQETNEHLVHFSTEASALLLDGMGDGISPGMTQEAWQKMEDEQNSPVAFLNQAAFGILQATRTRISKTEYISCPSCGRTLFDLQETTARIRAVTGHLKGVKIAIMGCIVNGPGEMADADFGYVGSGPGRITLYKGKEIVKRNISSEIAVDELINLLREHGAWTEPKKSRYYRLMNKNAWLILFAVALAADLILISADQQSPRIISKPLIVFSLFCWYGSISKRFAFPFRGWVLAALMFSVIGDIMLLFNDRSPRYFMLGLISFLIAHLCYIGFFHRARVASGIRGRGWLLLPVAIYYAFIITILTPSLGLYKVPVQIYAVVISFMFMLALHMLFLPNRKAGRLLVTGAFFFLISDSMLAIHIFYHSFPYADIAIMTTYAIAQLLLTAGAVAFGLSRLDDKI